MKKIRFSCDVCSKTFQHKNNMYRHRRSAHKLGRATNPKDKYICDHCGFYCELKIQLVQHIRENHNPKRKSGFKPPESRLKCPECDVHVKKYELLDAHLSEIHKINIEEEYLEFSNEKEFHTWKSNVEKETQSQFITVRGLRQGPNYSQREYFCNRSYNANLKSTGRKRAFKRHVTNKIGAACPSRIIVKMKDDKVEVNFIRTHVGHSAEVICLRLSSEKRAMIAEKLKNGATVQQVLDDVRDSATNETFQRVHCLQKKDIYNVIRDYKIKNVIRSPKKNDIKEQSIATTFPKLEDSSILHHNPDCENFSLIIMTSFQKCMLLEHPHKICVDDTRDTNAHEYQLVSIVVLDKYNNEVPVAFCFTKNVDLANVSFFFTKVKEAVGCPIKCNVFMSDEASPFYNAWTAVMGHPHYKLSCWWHVNQNWTADLNSMISNASKRKYVKRTLYSLANSTSDPDEFETDLARFLNYVHADQDTRPFHDYFSSYYLSQRRSWAFCYRKPLGLDSNSHFESMHKKIKHFYVEGKQDSTLEMVVNSLLKLVKNTMHERRIKLAKNQPSEKLLKTKIAHTKCAEIPDDAISCVKEYELWHVKSQKHKTLVYEISRVCENCQDSNSCGVRCPECDICSHTYKCSCADYFADLNICKHIHKIAELNKFNHDAELESYEAEIQVSKIVLVESQKNHDDGKENAGNEIQRKLQLLMHWSGNLSEDEMKFVSEKLDDAIRMIKSNRGAW